MDYRIVSVLGTDKITLAEAKNYIRITNTQDDTLIESMIGQAHNLAETYVSKDILAKSREVYIPYPCKEVFLPFAPIDTSVALVVTVEGSVLTAGDYTSFGYENPAIRLQEGARDVKIEYTTKGLGDEVKQGLLAAVAFLYKAAGRGDLEKMKNVMSDYKALLAPYRRLYI